MRFQWIKARRTKYGLYVTVYTLVIIAVVAVVNVLANSYVKTYDTTANKRYSLSDQTVKIVRDLQQDVTITYFDQTTQFQRARDLLDQYGNLSTRLHVRYSDPDRDPEAARQAGIGSYGTATVQIGDKKENAMGLTEESITGAIIRALKDTVRTVCFLAGNGEHRIDDVEANGYSSFKDVLARDNYQTQPISLLQAAEVPAACTAIVIGGPTTDYVQPQIDAIKKYIESGGRALFLLNPPLRVGQLNISQNTRLADLLSSWGVTLKNDLVLDVNPLGQLVGVGPQVSLVSEYGSHAIVNVMRGTATGFPMSRTLEMKNTDKTTVEKLFDSSASSLATGDLQSNAIDVNAASNRKGPFTIAVAGTYNTGQENSQGRFVVVGTSFWAANSYISLLGNSDLVLNTVNWLASDEDLISIRPKENEDRPINMTNAQLRWVTIWSQFILPLAVVLMGVSVWWRRR
jgi:ABC-type uncharacterized transport system involved in gliding motility auxiliary subunit